MLPTRHLYHTERAKHINARQKSKNHHSLPETVCLQKKLQLWKNNLERGQTAAFPSMNKYLEEWNQTDSSRFDVIKPILVEHLKNLITEFDRYLLDINLEAQLWVRNPLLAKVDNLSENVAGRAYWLASWPVPSTTLIHGVTWRVLDLS